MSRRGSTLAEPKVQLREAVIESLGLSKRLTSFIKLALLLRLAASLIKPFPFGKVAR